MNYLAWKLNKAFTTQSVSAFSIFLIIVWGSLWLPSTLHAGLEKENKYGAGLKFTGLTYHPDGGENEGYPRQLDDGAYFVLQVGLEGSADYYIRSWLLIRTAHALYRDCADVWAGYHHLGVRLNLPVGESFAARVGIGPSVLWRQNWLGKVEGYRRDSFFGEAKGGSFQNAFIWHGGDIELEWKFNKDLGLVYSVIPGWPEVLQNSLGLRASW